VFILSTLLLDRKRRVSDAACQQARARTRTSGRIRLNHSTASSSTGSPAAPGHNTMTRAQAAQAECHARSIHSTSLSRPLDYYLYHRSTFVSTGTTITTAKLVRTNLKMSPCNPLSRTQTWTRTRHHTLSTLRGHTQGSGCQQG
jgi:hypothetical protein